ncbi:hypothetical protein OAJ07_03030 [Gemmatimonadales bacterium]|nr:hypothetical protein [Gemmatimonadales bacterium]
MPSDYKAITESNTKRLGTDTRSRRSQVSGYSDPTHFIYEILQNADDYGATWINFALEPTKLVITHDGEPFKENNVKAITYFGAGTSEDDPDKEGRFGVGFKSVFTYTASPRIASGDERFEISNLYCIQPWQPPSGTDPRLTLFELPFNHGEEKPDFVADDEWKTPEQAYEMIGSKLKSRLEPTTLLFTKNLKKLTWSSGDNSGSHTRNDSKKRGFRETTISAGTAETEVTYLVFSRKVHFGEEALGLLSLAFPLDTADKPIKSELPLSVLFPTTVQTGFEFIIDGPFRTPPSRETIYYEGELNNSLLTELGELVSESLITLRDQSLLTTSLIEVLPNSNDRLDDFFEPVRTAIFSAFKSEDLIPTDQKKTIAYARVENVRTGPPNLRKVIGTEELAFLTDHEEIQWAAPARHNSRCAQFFEDIGIQEWDWEKFSLTLVFALDEELMEWLKQRPVKWLETLYIELHAARDKASDPKQFHWFDDVNIMRARRKREVDFFSFKKVFFPRGGYSGLPQVEKELLEGDPKRVRKLRDALTGLGVKEIGASEEADKILQRYLPHSLNENPPDKDRHLKDIKQLIKFWQKGSLTHERIRSRSIFRTKKDSYQNATKCYLSDSVEKTGLHHIFDHADNPLPERYPLSPWYAGVDGFVDFADFCGVMVKLSLTPCSVSDRVPHPEEASLKQYGGNKSKNTIDQDYYVCGKHPDALSGFRDLPRLLKLSNPDVNRLIWNLAIASTEEQRSAEYRANDSKPSSYRPARWIYTLRKSTWLLDKEGELRTPSEIVAEDIDPSFKGKNKGFLELIELGEGIGKPSAKEQELIKQADSLGITPDLAKEMSDLPREDHHKIAKFVRDLKKEKRPRTVEATGFQKSFHTALEDVFSKPGTTAAGETQKGLGGSSPNPDRRRKKTKDQISAAQASTEPESFSRSVKIWTPKLSKVRTELQEWYGGKCQICDSTFDKRNGQPYFEANYLVSYKDETWFDRVGNVLCLCPQHSAMMQHGPIETESQNLRKEILELQLESEGGTHLPFLEITLCGEKKTITYVDNHILDLQEMIRASQEQTDRSGDN